MLIQKLYRIREQKVEDLSARLAKVLEVLTDAAKSTPGPGLRFDVAISVFDEDPPFVAKLVEQEFRNLMLKYSKGYSKGEHIYKELIAELYIVYYENYNNFVCNLDAIYDGVIKEIWKDDYQDFCEQMTQEVIGAAKLRINSILKIPCGMSTKDALLYKKNDFKERYANFRYLNLFIDEVDQQLSNLTE